MGRGPGHWRCFLGADDIPGDLAELYGYVNPLIFRDAELDCIFVDALATRIGFRSTTRAISETKRFADVASFAA